MRTLTTYINEAIKIGASASNISIYSCQPKDKKELKKIIEDRVKSEGFNCDLNDIDTSLITDMSELFIYSNFHGDISRWDVSKVESMKSMFDESAFNQDISKWNVSNVKNMYSMFAWSSFNQDISNWKINKNCDTEHMFTNCPIREEYKPKIQ